MKTWTAIFIGVAIGVLSGVGLQQVTLAGDVRENKIELRSLKDEMTRRDKVFEERMGNIIRLWEAQLNAEHELIALVREQIRVIERTGMVPK